MSDLVLGWILGVGSVFAGVGLAFVIALGQVARREEGRECRRWR